MQLTGAGSLVMYRRVMDVPSFGAFLVVLFPIPSRLSIVSVTTDTHPSTGSPIYFRKPCHIQLITCFQVVCFVEKSHFSVARSVLTI